MFEGDQKIFLLLAAAGALVFAAAAEVKGPRPERAFPAASVALPALPEEVTSPDRAPLQTAVAARQVDLGDGFEASLLYGYVLEGRVVTRREYRTDGVSTVSPLDLGVVWGELAAPGAVADWEFRNGRRAIFYRPDDRTGLPANWEEMVTNNHLLPASEAVQAALLDVEVGQTIRIRGYLVEVTGDTVAPWRSSTRRDDATIIGGCEIILVREVEILPEMVAGL